MNAYVVLSTWSGVLKEGTSETYVEGVFLTRESAEKRRDYLAVLTSYEHATLKITLSYLEGPES